MKFVSLLKFYYKNTPEEYEKEYQKRFKAPFANHFQIQIHQYNRKASYPAFLYYPNNLLNLLEKFYKTYEKFTIISSRVPKVVLYQFTLLSIVEEIKSTNDIEGVHSTRKEIRDILEEKGPQLSKLKSIVHKYRDLMGEKEIKFNLIPVRISENFMMNLHIRKFRKKIRKIDWTEKFSEREKC